MVQKTPKSRSTLRAPYDLDRRNGHCMEAAHFRSFYYFEPDIQSGHHCEPNIQFKLDIQSGVITHADSPDFRIRVGNNIIGVEVRKLFTSLDGPALESTQESIFDQACRKAERLNLPPADVTLFFNLRRPLREADRRRIADAVVQVVADNMPADGDTAQLEHRPGQPSEVDLIQINRGSRREVGRWRADFKFSEIESNRPDIVQKAITEKAARLLTYLTACDECWLLLVADSFKASGNLEFGAVGQTHTFSSPFTRTYVLDFGRGRLHRLETADAAPSRPPTKAHGAPEARGA
jgi:hypothetical protein